jgi:hypothetical protein
MVAGFPPYVLTLATGNQASMATLHKRTVEHVVVCRGNPKEVPGYHAERRLLRAESVEVGKAKLGVGGMRIQGGGGEVLALPHA